MKIFFLVIISILVSLPSYANTLECESINKEINFSVERFGGNTADVVARYKGIDYQFSDAHFGFESDGLIWLSGFNNRIPMGSIIAGFDKNNFLSGEITFGLDITNNVYPLRNVEFTCFATL